MSIFHSALARRGGLVAVLILTAACSFAGEIEPILDVEIGPDPMQRIDIYKPRNAAGKLPAVLWIHGGGWTEGDKRLPPNGIGPFAKTLVDNGYVAFSCNYRLGPKHNHPAQIDDVERAVRWIRKNAEKYQVDPERIGVFGISAGGHLAALMAVRQSHPAAKDGLDSFSSKIQAAIALNGATDFSEDAAVMTPIVKAALPNLLGKDPAEAAKRREESEPIRLVGKHAAPLLFIAGELDDWVPPAHSYRMAEALKKAGATTEVVELKGLGHGIFPSITPGAQKAILHWFGKYLKPEAKPSLIER